MKALIADVMREWQAARGPVMTARTRATNVAPVNAICEALGEYLPKDLMLRRVETFRNTLLERGLSKITVARYLSVLRSGLGESGSHLPLHKLIAELKRAPNVIDCFTKEEAASIIRVAKEDWNGNGALDLFIKILFATGCRRGEALALQCEDVDFKKARIHFHLSLALDGSLQNGTKWGGERWCPMSDSMAFAMSEYLGCERVEKGTLLSYLDQRTVGRSFKWAREIAGARPFKMHCTRHSAISWALSAGMSLRKASEIFGVSQGTLESHYAHYVEEKVNMDWANL